MKIGIVTTWFERGAAYVSKIYMDALQREGHTVYIYARGGETHESQKSEEWNQENVVRSNRYTDSRISAHHFFSWIRKNKLDAIFFNEQREYAILYKTKRKFPKIKLGAYVDYYTEDTLCYFDFFDFLICNTKRHMQAMEKHPQKYYVKWGTNIDLYKPECYKNEQITFFHSVGMSPRKGTDILVDAFIDGKLYEKSRLVIHTQIPIEKVCGYTKNDLEKFGIEIIEKTVSAPGLYYIGDVYVYPTRLDGLGLTMYEALSSGLPMITTDFPPMNEVGDDSCVKYVKPQDFYCRSDAYYYPLAVCDKDDLIDKMYWFVNHKDKLFEMKLSARRYAVENYNISCRSKEISEIFITTHTRDINDNLYKKYKRFTLVRGNIVSWLLTLRIISEFKQKSLRRKK